MSAMFEFLEVGDVVLWHLDADVKQPPCMAFVVRVRQSGIVDLMIVTTNGVTFKPEVRHVGDPLMVRPEVRGKSGGWEFKNNQPLTKSAVMAVVPELVETYEEDRKSEEGRERCRKMREAKVAKNQPRPEITTAHA